MVQNKMSRFLWLTMYMLVFMCHLNGVEMI